jgi:hypothetical protein
VPVALQHVFSMTAAARAVLLALLSVLAARAHILSCVSLSTSCCSLVRLHVDRLVHLQTCVRVATDACSYLSMSVPCGSSSVMCCTRALSLPCRSSLQALAVLYTRVNLCLSCD